MGAFARRCVCVSNRSQPSPTVRNRPQPFVWGPYGRAYGECCKSSQFWRFQTLRNLVSRGRRGALWHSNIFHNVSKIVSVWQAQYFWVQKMTQHFGDFHVISRGRRSIWCRSVVCGIPFCVAGAVFGTLYTLHFTLSPPHSTLHTPHSTLYTLDSTLHAPQSTLHTVHLHFTLYTWHSALYTLHSTLYTPHFTLHTLHSTLYTLNFTRHGPRLTLDTLHSTLYTLHFTLYPPHFTL